MHMIYHSICRVLLAIAGVIAMSGASAQTQVIVNTDTGMLAGIALAGSAAAFRGIPYAAPPVGELRWRPAQPVQPWSGVLDASAFGTDCPQPLQPGQEAWPQSEDCLHLNIVTPDMEARGLPVLVVIHGGAFFVGSGRELADQNLSAIVRQGVVLVSPNYRIGRLGFFSHPELTRRSRERGDALSNYWLSDQIAALRWVQRNIQHFGGDAGNITILGCSAGGSSVNALMSAPDAHGLFTRASARSAGGLFNASRSLATAEAQGREFASRTEETDEVRAFERLLELTADELLALESGAPDFGAIADGELLPEPTSIAFANGQIANVPYMVGSTSDEASIFGLMGFDRNVLAERFGIELDALRADYGDLDEAELLRQVQTDFIFISGSMGLANLAMAAGVPTYAYYFDYVRESRKHGSKGAPHCADMAYTFATLKSPAPEDARIADMMQGYLLSFIRSGNPNHEGQPHWPQFTRNNQAALVINKTTTAVPQFRSRQLQPWYRRWQREHQMTLLQ